MGMRKKFPTEGAQCERGASGLNVSLRWRQNVWTRSGGTVTGLGVAVICVLLATSAAVSGAAGAPFPKLSSSAPSWAFQRRFDPYLQYVYGIGCHSTHCIAAGAGPQPANSGGYAGAVAFTQNGSAWMPGLLPAGVFQLNGVSCATTADCWAVGEATTNAAAVIVATTDGGSQWTAENAPSGVGDLASISCPSTSNCIVLENGNGVVATTDGGEQWQTETPPGALDGHPGISCASDSYCWTEGTEAIGPAYITTNLGVTWSAQSFPGGDTLVSLSCPAAGDCWASANYANSGTGLGLFMLETTNNGASWTHYAVPLTPLGAVECVSMTDCFVMAANSKQAVSISTTDGGTTWKVGTFPAEFSSPVYGPFAYLVAVTCSAGTDCFAIGDPEGPPAVLATTTDFGSSWTTSGFPSGPVAFDAVTCANVDDCWAGGTDVVESGAVVATTDSGGAWAPQSVHAANSITGMACPTSEECMATTDTRFVSITRNGGTQWTSKEVSSSEDAGFLGVSCPSSLICWVVGGPTEKTTDAGSVWKVVQGGSVGNPDAASCPTTNVCVVVGSAPLGSNDVEYTSDGGAVWTAESAPGDPSLSDVSCSSATSCVAVGDDVLLTTTDGGRVWTSQEPPVVADIDGVSCPSTDDCWAVGYTSSTPNSPVILTSDDAGSTWTTETVPGGMSTLNGVFCLNTTHCWAVGTTSPGGVAIISTVSSG